MNILTINITFSGIVWNFLCSEGFLYGRISSNVALMPLQILEIPVYKKFDAVSLSAFRVPCEEFLNISRVSFNKILSVP